MGCSGGIADYWKIFNGYLTAVGFDPLVNEIKRLNKENKNKSVSYQEGFIGWKDYEKHFPKTLRENAIQSKNNCSFDRTSSMEAAKSANYDYTKIHFNDGQDVLYSSQYIDLDDHTSSSRQKIDFLKIDTDGHDFECLLGAQRLLQSGCLGVLIECQFHGPVHPYANTFCNIDRFLREKGFSLFSLTSYNHSKGHLPDIFKYDIFAQTNKGQVRWGDALYFRDFGDKDYEKKFPDVVITPENLLKLACLYDLFDHQDSLAELIHVRGEMMGLSKEERTMLLDLITPPFQGKPMSYVDYINLFKKDPMQWFPSHQKSLPKRAVRTLYKNYLAKTPVGSFYRKIKSRVNLT